jgi:RNA polymerase sigma-70 factor (ECF subfamily)
VRQTDLRSSEDPLSKIEPSGVVNARKGSALRDEDALVEAARTDREAFGVLYDRYFDAIYHYVARRIGDEEAAEDVTAAVWERALIAIERYQVRGVPFAAWLYRIAGNLVANHHRGKGVWRLVPLQAQVAMRAPKEDLDERAAVRGALQRLADADQEVLSLFYYAGLSPVECAEVLGCSVAALHKRLHRARERLRRELEGEGHASARLA